MALKIAGGGPAQETRPSDPVEKGYARYTSHTPRRKPFQAGRIASSFLFAAFLVAVIGVFACYCYGVLLGILALAHEPRGTQVAIAVFAAAVILALGLVFAARGDQ